MAVMALAVFFLNLTQPNKTPRFVFFGSSGAGRKNAKK